MRKANIFLSTISVGLVMVFIGCEKPRNPDPNNEFKGSSEISLSLDGNHRYSLNDNPCDILPTSSTFIGDHETNLIKVPIFSKMGDLSPMVLKIYVENLDYPYEQGPDYTSLLDKIVLFQDQINKGSQEVKLITRVAYEDKVYSNSWDPEYKKDKMEYHFLQDRTGLQVNEVIITEETPDCLPQRYKDNPLIRMQANLNGPIVTEDLKDTVTLTGTIDLYLTSLGI
ncbi:hypothetical protein [Membranihabitans marinus]|uniref:hypothetical protein n=1 Tax=Membranihabitans marinus TaxID=1227546 RepID=UPI001F1EF811|nr:hypothetical protein [Membranihabitans marinus]